jgi:hypothetical protein
MASDFAAVSMAIAIRAFAQVASCSFHAIAEARWARERLPLVRSGSWAPRIRNDDFWRCAAVRHQVVKSGLDT